MSCKIGVLLYFWSSIITEVVWRFELEWVNDDVFVDLSSCFGRKATERSSWFRQGCRYNIFEFTAIQEVLVTWQSAVVK